MSKSAGPIQQAVDRVSEALAPEAELVVVGGWVRDHLLGRDAGDMDLATALMPEEVMRRAKAAGLKTVPTGLQHGTVTVISKGQGFEITTFRGDGDYRDGRHPECVHLGVSLQEDLARRDFTINAMALPVEFYKCGETLGRVIDPFGGESDIERRLIRAVGDPLKRFAEDGLRPLRACRFASQLGFNIEEKTLSAISQRLDVSAKVSVERVFVELTKLLCGLEPKGGLQLLADSGLLDLWTPELRPMIGCEQTRHHRFPVWEHTLEAVAFAPPEPALRWAALLHDVGKPATRTIDETGSVHFYGHEARSLEITLAIFLRLKVGHAFTREVLALVRHHGTHPLEEWSDAACRRFLRKLTEDGLPLEEWGRFRIADQLAKGFDEASNLLQHQRVMERMMRLAEAKPPLSPNALALDGKALIQLAEKQGGPWLGSLQKHLLDVVIEDPARNTPEELKRCAVDWLKDSRGQGRFQ
ncbi:MAG: HD domain-containing protein [Holophagaceae bacterium]|nr:HD domain-containing protein [Holophagaceae bacterium]